MSTKPSAKSLQRFPRVVKIHDLKPLNATNGSKALIARHRMPQRSPQGDEGGDENGSQEDAEWPQLRLFVTNKDDVEEFAF